MLLIPHGTITSEFYRRYTTHSPKSLSQLRKATKGKSQNWPSIHKEPNSSLLRPIKLLEFGTSPTVNASRSVTIPLNSCLGNYLCPLMTYPFNNFHVINTDHQVLEGHKDEIFSCAFNYEGSAIITGSKDNSCRIWT